MNDKIKRYILNLGEIAAMILCALIIGKFLEYLLVSEDGFTKQLMEDFYEMDTNIDNVYLGSSHVHYNVKPQILDEMTGENNFNLATGLQPMNTTYYLLREASKNNKIAHVYLELSCGLTVGEYGEIKTYEQLPNSWRVLDYVKPSINKLQWMLDISDPEYYYLSFIPARRYHKELLSGDYIAGQLKNKSEDEETKWKGGYVYKGYRETDAVITGMYSEKSKSTILGKEPITNDIMQYLLKIIQYCKKNRMELTLFTAPILECELNNFVNYDNWGNEVRVLAKENGINYFDFNLCRQEYLNLNDEKFWRDNNHLNIHGAEVFTKFMGEVFEEEKSQGDTDKYFYDNYQQKMERMEKKILGMTVDEVWDEEKRKYLEEKSIDWSEESDYRVFLVSSVDNFADSSVEYYFSLLSSDNNNEYTIQDWSVNSICIVPVLDNGNVLNIAIRRNEFGNSSRHEKSARIFLDK